MSAHPHMRDVVFPPLPDSDEDSLHGAGIHPHPDGRPWLKACGECALRTSDPQCLGAAYQQRIAEGREGTVFWCIHRYDGDHNRVCACYAALHLDQAEKKT